MQARRPASVSPLEIVLPHPSLPRRRSSLLSASSAASPRTPGSCTGGSPCSSFFFAPTTTANRKSTDSWNSSNLDIAEEKEWDWKPEQTLLLSRTLDALPAHLITPFGPVPPSNLLDKIARGVSQAKGASEWPHSVHATRCKLVELARIRAKEEQRSQENNFAIPEEERPDRPSYAAGDILQQTTNIGNIGPPRRPLYRQSSMDFMNVTPGKPNLKDNDNIHRLSNRLQRADRIINPPYHPYSRGGDIRIRPSSPNTAVPSLSTTSNPSTSTLSSTSTSNCSSSSYRGMLRRSASTLTSVSNSSSVSGMSVDDASYLGPVATDPRVQRVRRSESFCSPPVRNTSSTHRPLKRAPSFGTHAQESRKPGNENANARIGKLVGETPSSDEEEKIRTRGAKKLRTKNSIASLSSSSSEGVLQSSPAVAVPATPVSNTKKKNVQSSTDASPTPAATKKRAPTFGVENIAKPVSGSKRFRANVTRNPSIFGPELPHPQQSPPALSDAASPPSLASAPDFVASAPKLRTLRRVRRLMPGRKISFGTTAAGNDADEEEDHEEKERSLGSAFQLS